MDDLLRQSRAHPLERFVEAQDAAGTYRQALEQLRAGRKTSHWIWFVFPQLAGLGASEMSRRYAIASLEEARAYLEHPVLGPRLRECCEAILSAPGSAEEILGPVDAVKLRSSLTLFLRAARAEPDESGAPFDVALARFFGAAADPETDRLLAEE